MANLTQDALKKLRLENDKKTYAAWLAESKITPSYSAKELAKAKADAYFDNASYGTSASALNDSGLVSSGYADYVNQKSALSLKRAAREDEETYMVNQYKSGKGYADYVDKYESLQEKTKQSVTQKIINSACFDVNEAYQLALTQGLSEDNAIYTAEEAVRLSLQKATKKAISYVNANDFSPILAQRYARNAGLPEPYVREVVKAARNKVTFKEKDVYNSISAEEYENYLEYMSKK